jgi:hypothetical protein
MSAISIAIKDIQIFLKDRGMIIQLFLIPIVFILAFSAVAAGFGSDGGDQRLPLPVVDLDEGDSAETLLEGLDRPAPHHPGEFYGGNFSRSYGDLAPGQSP